MLILIYSHCTGLKWASLAMQVGALSSRIKAAASSSSLEDRRVMFRHIAQLFIGWLPITHPQTSLQSWSRHHCHAPVLPAPKETRSGLSGMGGGCMNMEAKRYSTSFSRYITSWGQESEVYNHCTAFYQLATVTYAYTYKEFVLMTEALSAQTILQQARDE